MGCNTLCIGGIDLRIMGLECNPILATVLISLQGPVALYSIGVVYHIAPPPKSFN